MPKKNSGIGLMGYNSLIELILEKGNKRGDRTDTGTLSLFGIDTPLMFENVGENFPAIYQKDLAWKAVMGELLWFLAGSTNLKDLKYLMFGDPNSSKRTIWDDNYENEGKALGYTDGEMGPVYGLHMRAQLEKVIKAIKKYPEDRRLVMSNWQDAMLDEMTLPPCHGIHTQFYVHEGVLHLNSTMRSVDVFLGLPFNIASYAALLCIVAQLLGLEAGTFKMYLVGDTHIYLNHISQCEELLNRPLRKDNNTKLILPENITLEKLSAMEYRPSDFILEGYEGMGKISAPMAFKKN